MKAVAKILWTSLAGTAFVLVFVLSLGSAQCGPQSKTARDLEVRIADDVCSEVLDAVVTGVTGATGATGATGTTATNVDPQLVALLCDAGSEKIRVLLPRREWYAMRQSKEGSLDAGPGK